MAVKNKPNSTNNRNSRYVQGGLTDIYKNRLGWWERRKFIYDDTDVFFTIDEISAQRPDIISYRLYGTEKYDWLVLQYNNIVDSVEELVEGKTIRMPTENRLMLDILTKVEGGNYRY